MIYRILGDLQRHNAIRALEKAPVGCLVEIREETRTEAQNRKLWPMLTDIAGQVEWDGGFHSPEVWKDLLTAVFKNAKLVAGLEGGAVAVGLSTSRMSKKKFSEFIEFIYAEGTTRGVIWSEKALETYAEYREAQ